MRDDKSSGFGSGVGWGEAGAPSEMSTDLMQISMAYGRTERSDFGARIELLFAAVMALSQRPTEVVKKEASEDEVILGLLDELDRRVGVIEAQNKEARVAFLAAQEQVTSQMREVREQVAKARIELNGQNRKIAGIQVDHDLLLHALGGKDA